MLRILLTGAAVALAAPAYAQEAQPTEPAAPMSEMQGETAAVADSSTDTKAQVAAVVETEFPAYDADKSGQLEEAEFSKWILALKEQEMKSSGKAMNKAELTSWASNAFMTADIDRNAAVTKDELTRYLGG